MRICSLAWMRSDEISTGFSLFTRTGSCLETSYVAPAVTRSMYCSWLVMAPSCGMRLVRNFVHKEKRLLRRLWRRQLYRWVSRMYVLVERDGPTRRALSPPPKFWPWAMTFRRRSHRDRRASVDQVWGRLPRRSSKPPLHMHSRKQQRQDRTLHLFKL